MKESINTLYLIGVLPKDNVTMDSYSFIESIIEKLNFKGIYEVNNDFFNLCRTVHKEFTEEEYQEIRTKHRIRYSIWEKNAAFLNKVICSSDDKLNDYNKAIEIISIKDSVMSSIASDIIKKCKSLDDVKTEAEKEIAAGEIINKAKKEFIRRTMQYRGKNGKHLFDSYFVMYIHDKVISDELLSATYRVATSKNSYNKSNRRYIPIPHYPYSYTNNSSSESVKSLRWQ